MAKKNKLQISLSELKEVLHDKDKYNEILINIQKLIANDINEAYSVYPLYEGSKTNMTLGNMFTLLILLKSYSEFPEMELDKDDIIEDLSKIDSYDTFFDRVIKKFHLTYGDNSYDLIDKLQEQITYSINTLSIFTNKHVLLEAGPSFSIKDIMDIGKRNPRFFELLNFKHSTHTNEIENIKEKIKIQDDYTKELVKIIREDGKSQFNQLLSSGGGININQFGEIANLIGYKPDIRGRVITTPIDTSYFRGMKKVSDYYIDAMGARKALITAKLQVKSSGYLNRKISILSMDMRIDKGNHDCGTKHYLPITIRDKATFKLFIGRYYVIDGKDYLIKEEDEHLIGATLMLRSPLTCACSGSLVCEKCYGHLSSVNRNLNIGVVANLLFTEPMTQKLLSSKHCATRLVA